MSVPPQPPKQKTPQQTAKENAFLSRCKLCRHNLTFSCNPPNGRACNFAHFLNELQAPEESQGHWSKAWDMGDVDIRFWYEYRPNLESTRRFTEQFDWERKRFPTKIPPWAWGHAVELGLLSKRDVPDHVPHDFDWPTLQAQWQKNKKWAGALPLGTTTVTSHAAKQTCSKSGGRHLLMVRHLLRRHRLSRLRRKRLHLLHLRQGFASRHLS